MMISNIQDHPLTLMSITSPMSNDITNTMHTTVALEAAWFAITQE